MSALSCLSKNWLLNQISIQFHLIGNFKSAIFKMRQVPVWWPPAGTLEVDRRSKQLSGRSTDMAARTLSAFSLSVKCTTQRIIRRRLLSFSLFFADSFLTVCRTFSLSLSLSLFISPAKTCLIDCSTERLSLYLWPVLWRTTFT